MAFLVIAYPEIAQSDFDRTTRLLAASGAAVAPRRRPPRNTDLPFSAPRQAAAGLTKQTSSL